MREGVSGRWATRRMMGAAAVLALACAGGDAAWAACDGKNVIFSDDFIRPNPSWGPASPDAFRNGKYLVSVQPNGSIADWPSAVSFSGSYSVCVQVKLPNDPTGAAGSGLLFWIDPEKNKAGQRNHYMAMVSPDGYYWVARTLDGQRKEIVESVQSNVVKTGANAINEIAVDLRENAGILFINGKEVGRFTGQPPKQSFAGISAGAPLDKKYVVEFSAFRVVKP